jgi:UDP-N-acetylglucosamine 2-epimerase
VGYRASLSLQLHARAVVTDSGGIERESSWLGTPVVVLRECTEWPGIGSTPVGLNAYRALSAIAEVQRKPERIPTGASKRIAAAFSRRSERVAA